MADEPAAATSTLLYWPKSLLTLFVTACRSATIAPGDTGVYRAISIEQSVLCSQSRTVAPHIQHRNYALNINHCGEPPVKIAAVAASCAWLSDTVSWIVGMAQQDVENDRNNTINRSLAASPQLPHRIPRRGIALVHEPCHGWQPGPAFGLGRRAVDRPIRLG